MEDVVDVFGAAHRSTRAIPDDVFSQAHASSSTAAPPAHAIHWPPSSQMTLTTAAPSLQQQPPPVALSQPQFGRPAASTSSTAQWSRNEDPPTRNAFDEAGDSSLRVHAIQAHAASAIARARGHLTSEIGPTSSPSAQLSVNETVQRGRDVLHRARESRRLYGLDKTADLDFHGLPEASVSQQLLQPSVATVPASISTPRDQQKQAVALHVHASCTDAFQRSRESNMNTGTSTGGIEFTNQSLQARYGSKRKAYVGRNQTPLVASRIEMKGSIAPTMKLAESPFPVHSVSSSRPGQTAQTLPSAPALPPRQSPPLPLSLQKPESVLQPWLSPKPEPEPEPEPEPPSLLKPPPAQPQIALSNGFASAWAVSKDRKQHHSDDDLRASVSSNGNTREAATWGSQLVGRPWAGTTAVSFNNTRMPAAADHCTATDESEEELFEELANTHATREAAEVLSEIDEPEEALFAELVNASATGVAAEVFSEIEEPEEEELFEELVNASATVAAAENCSQTDESEEELFEELANAPVVCDPYSRFEDRGELRDDRAVKAGSIADAGTRSNVSSRPTPSTDWEGSVWVKYQPLARTTTKPPRWYATLTASELKIYECYQDQMRGTKLPWKTVCSDDLTYAGCTEISVQLQGRKQKTLRIAAADAQLEAVDLLARSVRERTPWRGSVLLLQRPKAAKFSKYCSCEVEIRAASTQNRSDATGAMLLIVHHINKKTKQSSTMNLGIGDRPVISQISTESVSICLRDGVRLRISAGRVHTMNLWDALSNGLCAPLLQRRTRSQPGRDGTMHALVFYRVVDEVVAAETRNGDRNGAVFHRGDVLQCLQSAISPQGIRRILTDRGFWIPTTALTLVRDI